LWAEFSHFLLPNTFFCGRRLVVRADIRGWSGAHDHEFDDLAEPGDLITATQEDDSAQIGMSLLAGRIGITPAEMD
jgi:hypothetical protein